MSELEALQRLVEQQKAEIEQLKNDLKMILKAWRDQMS
jgi:cell division protein FtsB